jgi:hypothetical protein
MKKEELLAQKGEILNEIISLEKMVRELREKSHQLTLDYIEEHREFKNGDLVNVTHGKHKEKTEKAFIDSAQEYEGEITYRFLQVKKDGTPSSRRLYVDYWYYDREEKKVNIELVNTDYRNKNFDGTPKTTEQ